MNRLIIDFNDAETLEAFLSWLSDGGGEYSLADFGYEDGVDVKIDYGGAFSAHGWDGVSPRRLTITGTEVA